MAKHPHRLLLVNNKTWKCTLEGCAFFVHRGLEHVLVGKRAECWTCGDQYTFSEESLKDPKPECADCLDLRVERAKARAAGIPEPQIVRTEERITPIAVNQDALTALRLRIEREAKEARLKQSVAEIKSNAGLTDKQMEEIEEDEIENEYIHSPDCPSWKGGECNCM